ncbi:MAG: tellurite resistance TerB family protein, partial [Cryomorphaceae bacterium]|nr:tellurite resistance TerB family protein [Cryomorphaceae bacterium]
DVVACVSEPDIHLEFIKQGALMDAMDILGGLPRRKSGSSGLGGQILKSIVTGGRSSTPAAQEFRPVPQMPPGRPRIVDAPAEASQPQLGGLEDMLRQAHSRAASPRQPVPQAAPPPQVPQPRQQLPAPRRIFPPAPAAGYHDCSLDQKGELIVQAMINAAKADGHIDQAEQDKIVQQMGQLTQDDVEYLRREFAKPLNLRDFAWSVPLGAEQEIYAISIMTLNLDTNAEVSYLKDLAHV